jgi:hypothetical protein
MKFFSSSSLPLSPRAQWEKVGQIYFSPPPTPPPLILSSSYAYAQAFTSARSNTSMVSSEGIVGELYRYIEKLGRFYYLKWQNNREKLNDDL